MATFFGIEERSTPELFDRDMVCLPRRPDGKLDLHNVVAPIKKEDIVFIKHSTTPYSLKIKAVGVIKSDYPSTEHGDICMPVEWVWLGEKKLDHFDELLSVRSDLIYEEHDIVVQMEINNLLPEEYKLQPEW
jgi:hypothetical protein